MTFKFKKKAILCVDMKSGHTNEVGESCYKAWNEGNPEDTWSIPTNVLNDTYESFQDVKAVGGKVFIYTLTANSSNDTKTNNILMFQDIKNVKIKRKSITIIYKGKSTGTINKASFRLNSIAGYTMTNMEVK